jgi:hypothetical protein
LSAAKVLGVVALQELTCDANGEEQAYWCGFYARRKVPALRGKKTS